MPAALPTGEPWPQENKLSLSPTEATFHAYVHIPFCEVRCGYCDFNTYTQAEIGDVSRSSFHKSLIDEIKFSASVIDRSGSNRRELTSVFLGGGTPSLLELDQVSDILQALKAEFGFSQDCEITMEANPESLQLQSLAALVAAGVNRVSIGAQSFDPAVLNVLDRTHDPAKVAPLVEEATQVGLRVSVDLIFGAPGETLDSWRETLDAALSLGTGHISAYSLIVEPGTKLSRQISKGEIPSVDEDLNAQKYELLTQAMESAGLDWYEISNFGDPSIHNLAYWHSQDWWGYGPGAHSHLSGYRFWNKKHPKAYQSALAAGSPAHALEQLTPRQQLEEELMLSLRTKFGVRRELFSELAVKPEKVAEQIADGNLTTDGKRVYLTRQGRLIADRLVLNFLV